MRWGVDLIFFAVSWFGLLPAYIGIWFSLEIIHYPVFPLRSYWPIYYLFQGFSLISKLYRKHRTKNNRWMIFHPRSLTYPMSKLPVSGDWELSASKLEAGVCIDRYVDGVLYHMILAKATFLVQQGYTCRECSHFFCMKLQNTPFYSDTKWFTLISYGASFTFLVKLNCSIHRILRKSHIVIRSMTFDLSIYSLCRLLCNNVQYQRIVIKKQKFKPVKSTAIFI